MTQQDHHEPPRWLADHIPDARLVELDGDDHSPQIDSDAIMEAIESFLAEI